LARGERHGSSGSPSAGPGGISTRRIARRLRRVEEFLDAQDVVVVMTREHLADVRARLTNPHTEVVLWRHLIDPTKDLDVADPYYGDDAEFDDCLDVIAAGGEELMSLLRSKLESTTPE
jgi:protein-tyrosine-phosphatase